MNCLQACNTVAYVLVMWLVLGQNLIVISTTGILLYAKVSPFIMYYYYKVHCFQTFEHMRTLRAIKAVKFHIHIY